MYTHMFVYVHMQYYRIYRLYDCIMSLFFLFDFVYNGLSWFCRDKRWRQSRVDAALARVTELRHLSIRAVCGVLVVSAKVVSCLQ